MLINMNAYQQSRVCPFCNKIHSVHSPYLNIFCECGGKYYVNTGDWLNRITGEKVKAPKSRCGCEQCEQCEQHKINKDETGFYCYSFAFTRRILSNMLDCEESLTSEQKEAFVTVIDTIEKVDKRYKEAQS